MLRHGADILAVRSRMVVPFWIERMKDRQFSTLEATDIQHAFQRRNDSKQSEWQFAPPGSGKIAHSAYMVEYCDHVLRFLFDGIGKTGCFYLRYDGATKNKWFEGVIQASRKYDARAINDSPWNRPTSRGWQQVLSESWKRESKWNDALPTLDLETDSNLHPEIWLSRIGVGVLSIPLVFRGQNQSPIAVSQVMDIQHDLATGQKSILIRDRDRNDIVRDFHECVSQLTTPLRSMGCVHCESRAMVYTTLELTSTAHDFSDEIFTTEVQRVIGHFAQVHPASHCGGRQDVRWVAINAEHCAAVDLGGFAHAILLSRENQSRRQHEYSVKRGIRTQVEYFPAALLAVLQRLIITELLRRAAYESSDSQRNLSEQISDIHRLALAFGLEGEFIQVSQRSANQKYHELAQETCEIQLGLQTLHKSLEGFHRIEMEKQAEERHREAKRAENNSKMIECFLASVYSVAVAYYLSTAIHFPHNGFAGVSMIVMQIASVATVYWKAQRRPQQSGNFMLLLYLQLYVLHFVVAKWQFNSSREIQSALNASETQTTVQEPKSK